MGEAVGQVGALLAPQVAQRLAAGGGDLQQGGAAVALVRDARDQPGVAQAGQHPGDRGPLDPFQAGQLGGAERARALDGGERGGQRGGQGGIALLAQAAGRAGDAEAEAGRPAPERYEK